MLWIGPSLGRVERACMRSVARHGHELALWCYDEPEGVPEKVRLRDASEVLPRSAIIRHSGGSVSLFSNRFRYELQRRGEGVWLDSDIYLLRPVVGEDYLLCRQPRPSRRAGRLLGRFRRGLPETINGGVLRLPPDSPLLPPLLELFEERTVPGWLPPRARAAARWRLATTGRSGLDRMPWGVAGPQALTALAIKFGLYDRALPPEVYQPVCWSEAAWILDPALRLEERCGPLTRGVHLWNERIKGFKDRPAPPGSFLARLHEEGA